MTTRAKYVAVSIVVAMLGTGYVAGVSGQGVQAGSVVGASTMNDDPAKAKAASELERAKTKVRAPVKVPLPAEPIKPGIQAAQELMKAAHYPQALSRLAELDSVPGKTVGDIYLIERTRVAIASLSGDQALLVRSMETVMATGQAPAIERMEFSEGLARNYFNQKDFVKAITWSTRYFGEGGHDPAIRRALLLSYYLNNDHARAAQEVGADILIEEQAGRKPSEEQLRLLVSSAQKLDNKAAYASALEKYAAYYPKAK